MRIMLTLIDWEEISRGLAEDLLSPRSPCGSVVILRW